MHHDLEDAIRRKAMTKEKVIKILSKLKHLMDDNDKETLEDLESKKWVSKEYLIAKSSKIMMKILMGTKNPGKIEGAKQAFEKQNGAWVELTSDEAKEAISSAALILK